MVINKKYIKITNKGEKHIIDSCKKLGSAVYTGNNGIMPYTNYRDNNNVFLDDVNKTWTCDLGTTDSGLIGEKLIFWINKYCVEFDLDANYLGALIEIESGLKLWNYVKKYTTTNRHSSASGVSQFLLSTLWDVIINPSSRYKGGFTDSEKRLIGTDNNGVFRTSFDYYDVKSETGRRSRRDWLHQNIIDHPEISIKAMCVYISYIAGLCDGLANVTLFSYNRGYKFAREGGSDYKLVVSKAVGFGGNQDYHVEGVNYVFKIFNKLDNSYGYNLL